jgi:acetylornithine deacetylase
MTERKSATVTESAAAKEARRLIAPIRKDVIALLRTLVRTNSVAVPPEGNEAAAQKALVKALKRYKLDVETYDTGFLSRSKHPYVRHERHYKGRPNVIARVPGTGRGKSVLLTGHIDTVPPGPNPWRQSPWSGRISRGRLYGRGAWDMKGGLVAEFAVAMALAKAGVRLGGDILCESVVDEEWAGGGGTLAGRLRDDTADACVIAEGTNLSVVRATRGGHFFEIAARAGDPSAYFSKEEVVSPAVPMGRLLGWIDGWTRKRRAIDRGETYKDFADPAPVQVLALEANRFDPETPWSTPLTARVRVYFQFLPQEDVIGVICEIRKSFDEFCVRDPFFSQHPPEWHDIVYPPLLGHELAADHPWTKCLHESAVTTLGREVPISAAEYPCDAFMIQNYYGIPTLLFGPSGAGAHNVDEYVTTKSVIETAETLLAAALVWCG